MVVGLVAAATAMKTLPGFDAGDKDGGKEGDGGVRSQTEMGGIKKSQLLLTEGSINEEDVNDKGADSEPEFESDSESEEMSFAEPSKDSIYNREGLLQKLEDIAWPENVDWAHKLNIDHDQAQEVDVNDDLARELAFFTQALDGARQAFDMLQSTGLPFLRPPDYYAEMVKADSHMLKVKGKLLSEKKRIEEAEERKKSRELKKIAKEVQTQKTKEREKRKKDEIESVKKWRKQRKQSGFERGGGEEAELNFDGEKDSFQRKKGRPEVGPGDRSGGFVRRGAGMMKGGKEKNKRERRESKFGYGGQKGMKKQNTAETTNDFRDFNKGDSEGKKRRKF